jgi:hypothetical protein
MAWQFADARRRLAEVINRALAEGLNAFAAGTASL